MTCILAMETSLRRGSLAALAGRRCSYHELPAGSQTAASLGPALEELLRQMAWRAADVDVVAVARGPGSFTGLRIGVTAAKTFAYAAEAVLIGVDTLEVIAAQVPAAAGQTIGVAMNAERGQWFVAQFLKGTDGQLQRVTDTAIQQADTWFASLPRGCLLAGPGLRQAGALPPGCELADQATWLPRADTVADLSAARHAAGDHDDLWTFGPDYIRPCAAEEKRSRR